MSHRSLGLRTTVLFALILGCGDYSQSFAVDTDPDPLKDIVQVQFEKKTYAFSLAEVSKGIMFKYTITVTKDIVGVIPTSSQVACYSDKNPSGLYPFEQISGNGQSYSLEDCGLGPPDNTGPRNIAKGTHRISYKWDGRNWTGSSDTGSPKGKAFPAGDYEMTVTLTGNIKTPKGMKPYQLIESVKVTLVK